MSQHATEEPEAPDYREQASRNLRLAASLALDTIEAWLSARHAAREARYDEGCARRPEHLNDRVGLAIGRRLRERKLARQREGLRLLRIAAASALDAADRLFREDHSPLCPSDPKRAPPEAN